MFWRELNPDDRAVVERLGSRKTYSARSGVFLEGDAPTHVVIILSGVLKIAQSSTDGREVLIEMRGPGSLVGELGPVEDVPRMASATAVGTLETLIIPANRFRQLINERPDIGELVLQSMSQRLRQSAGRQLEAATGDAFTRLCGRILELADWGRTDEFGHIEIESPLTQQEIAEWIGVSRDAVVLALGKLRSLGWIETGRRRIRILDLDAVRRAAIDQ